MLKTPSDLERALMKIGKKENKPANICNLVHCYGSKEEKGNGDNTNLKFLDAKNNKEVYGFARQCGVCRKNLGKIIAGNNCNGDLRTIKTFLRLTEDRQMFLLLMTRRLP